MAIKRPAGGGRVNKNGESPAAHRTDAFCQMCVAIFRLPGSGAQNGIAHRGTGRGTWTHGTRFWRPLLYQLSYARVKQKPQGDFPFLTDFDNSIIALLERAFEGQNQYESPSVSSFKCSESNLFRISRSLLIISLTISALVTSSLVENKYSAMIFGKTMMEASIDIIDVKNPLIAAKLEIFPLYNKNKIKPGAMIVNPMSIEIDTQKNINRNHLFVEFLLQ